MKPEIYYTVHDWMYKELGLRNGQILAMSYLYAVARSYREVLKLQPKDVARHTGMTERNARNVLKSLEVLGYAKTKIIRCGGLKQVYWMEADKVLQLVLKKRLKV